MILQQFHVGVLRAVQVGTDWWPDRLAHFDILDVVAWSAAFSRAPNVRIQYLTAANKATACGKTVETRVKTTVELGDPGIHIRRICAAALGLHLILVRQIRILLIEAVVLARIRGSMLALHLIGVLLLAALSELVHCICVSRRVVHAIWAVLPSVLRGSYLVPLHIVLLADKASHGAVRDRALAARDAGADGSIEIDHASRTLQRVPPEAVGLLAVLVQRTAAELPLADVCILGVDVFVAAPVDGG